ncbi:MAG: DUF3823 domain-containing protein [Adhaeribacter sp.]
MKKLIYIIPALLFLLSGCEFDNYEEPQSLLTGRLVYEGQPVEVKQGISVLQVYQPGWQTFEPMEVNVKQDGSFSALVYKGSYKLVPIAGNGPFVALNTDTIDVQVSGSQATVDVPVVPYFRIKDQQVQVSGNTLTATFKVEKIHSTGTLDKVGVYAGATILVDNQYNQVKTEQSPKGDLSQQITLTLNLNNVQKDFAFVRLGVKAKESAEYLYTPVQKVQIP